MHSLNDAADKLSRAQAEFPIPASCVNDILEARNGRGAAQRRILRNVGRLRTFSAGLTRSPACPTGSSTRPRTRPRFTTRPATTTDRHRAVQMPGEGGLSCGFPKRHPEACRHPVSAAAPGGGGARGPGSVPNIGGPGPTGSTPNTLGPSVGVARVFPKSPGAWWKIPWAKGRASSPFPDPAKTRGITPPKVVSTAPGWPSARPVTRRRRAWRRWGPRCWGASAVVPVLAVGGGLGSGGGLGGGAGVIAGGGSLGKPVSPAMGMMGGGAGAGAGRGGGGAAWRRQGPRRGWSAGTQGGRHGRWRRRSWDAWCLGAARGRRRRCGHGCPWSGGRRHGRPGRDCRRGMGSSAGYGGGEDVAGPLQLAGGGRGRLGWRGVRAPPGVLR